MTKQEWIETAELLLTSRRIDEIEETELAPKGMVTYQFSAKGHELAQILLAMNMRHKRDGATVYYRSRPYMLAQGLTIKESFSGSMAKMGGRSGGRDIGVVHNLPPRRGATVLPTSGDVGAQYTPAIGWAQAVTYRTDVLKEKDWKNGMAVAMGGDGSTATNGFWAALNIATTQNLPMLFFIEDNGWGISVPGEYQTPGGNIAKNLSNFTNLHILDGDGANPEEAADLVAQACKHVRARKSPVLLRLRVPRICGHSGADNQSYKSAECITEESSRDPLNSLKNYLLKKKIFNKASWAELEARVEKKVRAELEESLNDAEPVANTAQRYVFSNSEKSQTVGGLKAENIVLKELKNGADDSDKTRMNLINAVRRTLEAEIQVNDRMLVFGEDVGVKGGVHGATVDMQVKFGKDRVFDTSLSEEGIIGRAVGMAMAGLVPVPEIQFRKYLDPAMEQINDCGTIRWRTNGDFAAPMVVRIPVGFGKRTGDPWHSVSGEAIFAHTIGWRVAMPSNARDAVGLLRTALRGDDPTFFLEHRALLDTAWGRSPYPGDDFMVEFGKAAIIQEGTKATVVSWGAMLHRAKEAIDKMGESIELIDLRTIAPWDKETVLKSVRKTNRCLVVHEDTFTNGFGAEIAAVIAQEAFSHLDAPVERMATDDCPIPYNATLMDAVSPTAETIAERLKKLISF
ncbi:MAG: thiamine pyrophosphate-dependent enzyme [Bacteroidota bacterium]